MKLFFVSQGNLPSRWAHTIQQVKMAAAFGRMGCEVDLVTQVHPLHRLRPFDYHEWYGVGDSFRIRELISLRASLRRIQRRVYARHFAGPAVRLAVREGADLVYTRHHEVLAVALARGLPTIYESHRARKGRKFELLLELADREDLRAVVTVTAELARRYVAWGLPEEKLLVFPDAVDTGQVEAAVPCELRSQLGLAAETFVALYVGHLYEQKGIETLTLAAAELPDVAFVLVGGWPEDARRLRARAPKNVHVLGFVPNGEVPAYLAASDVLLLPNSARFDAANVTSPLKLFEYMAARRPIVASAIPALDAYLQDGENALLFSPDDSGALAKAILRVREDTSLAARLSERALADVAAFTWDGRARSILEFAGFGDEIALA